MASHGFQRIRTAHRKDSKTVERPATEHLLDLPPEVLLSIADFLPTTSASCLALCNRLLSRILGPRVWTSLQHQEQVDRIAFLSALAKDLPQYFVCHHCVRLHRSSAVQWPRSVPHRQSLPCVSKDVGLSYLWSSHYLLKFAHIQIAMKRHCYGSDHGFPLEAFLHTEVELNDARGTTTLLSVEARIVSDELLMRSQQWILLPRDRSDEFFTKGLLHHLCEHIRTVQGTVKDDMLSNLVRSKINQLEDQRRCSTQTLQCPECHMDFLMDAMDFKERGLAMFVTRWINLGAGVAPMDAKWRSHLRIPMPEGVVHQSHPAGSIRASFENHGGQSLEEITAENILKLFSRRERKLVTRGSDGLVWKWRFPGSSWWYIAPSGPVEEKPRGRLSFLADVASLAKYLLDLF
jgi:hypothetical protein